MFKGGVDISVHEHTRAFLLSLSTPFYAYASFIVILYAFGTAAPPVENVRVDQRGAISF